MRRGFFFVVFFVTLSEMMASRMTVLYTLSHDGKRLAQWTDYDRRTPPPRQFVPIPRQILARQEVAGLFRRSVVKIRTETKKGYTVELEGVKMHPTIL